MIALVLAVVVAVVGLGALVVVLVPYVRDPYVETPGDRPAANVIERVTGACHPEPSELTIERAHRIFRERKNCDMDRCGAKHAAYWFLVDERRLRPAREVQR